MGNYISRANTGLKTLVGYNERDEAGGGGGGYGSNRSRKRKREYVENLNDEEDDEDDSDDENDVGTGASSNEPNEEDEDDEDDGEEDEADDDGEEETNYDTYPSRSGVDSTASATVRGSQSVVPADDDAYISSLFDSPSASSSIMSIRNILNSSINTASSSEYNLLAAHSINQSLNASESGGIGSDGGSSMSLGSGRLGCPTSNATIEISKMRKNKKAKLIINKLKTPYKQKMKSTSQYIYNTLFIRGENSDVVVKALNKEYRLHKIYIMQSPYFQSMFKGAKWRESAESYIEIAIPDQNINEKALFTAFGSFYKEDIELIPIEVINVLACASLFSLDGLIYQCAQVMLENLNYKTVIKYYDASILYGVQLVTEKALKWLAFNIMTNSEINMSEISLSLFEKILASNDLIILQVETDLYTLCKKWLYFQFNRMDESSSQKMDAKGWQKLFNEFFKSRAHQSSASSAAAAAVTASQPTTSARAATGKESSELLEPAEAASSQETTLATNQERPKYILNDSKFKKYASIFKKIRLQHILADLSSIKVVNNDMIIPQDWIEPFYKKNWLKTLLVDQDQLSNEFELTRSEFDKVCFRFGRILNDDNTANWRWVGFNYGIDLLVSYRNRTLTLKRNCSTYGMSAHKGLLSNKATYRLYYVMRCLQLDKISGNCTWIKESELTCLDLNRNEEKFVLSIDSSVDFPIIINLHACSFPLSVDSSISAASTSAGN